MGIERRRQRRISKGEADYLRTDGMIKCKHCGGTGITKGPFEIDCAACQGSGHIIAGTCPACGGVKTALVVTTILCPQCKGGGVISLVDQLDQI
jgi:DnaJ-class molecular chaperone